MNWYKRVYADYQPMDVDALTYKLKMLGIEKVRPDKGSSGKLKSSGHARFHDPHSGTQSDVPIHRQEISGNTIKTHIVDFFNLGEVWKDLGPRPKNKTVKRLSPLFPWNKNKKEQEAAAEVTKQKAEEEKTRKKQEFLDAQPWNIMGKDILEEARLKQLRDEEETKEIERMIAEDDAARKAQESIKPALMPSMGGVKMNWYKQSQKMPTMKDIIWAIDKIIAEQYEFSVEELQQASSGNQEWLAKAAQKAGESLEDAVLSLFNKTWSTRDIARKLGLESKDVAKILKKYYPTKGHQEEYLSEKHDQNIVDVYQETEDAMQEDFNIYGISKEAIAEVLGITSGYVYRTLKYNDISLHALSKERSDRIAKYIIEIANDLQGQFRIRDIQREFQKRHNFKLLDRSAFSVVKLLNLGDKSQNDPAAIFKAFTTFVWNNIKGGISVFIDNPKKLSDTIDIFFNRYGQYHMDKNDLIKMVMAKIQVRDRTLDNIADPKNPNRHDPLITDESHPSYFLNNPDYSQPQLAENKMNWYKKARGVPGGLADKKKPSDFNKKQLGMGVEVEMEHTNDRDLSKDISMDHLEEFPDYYTELDEMEKKLEKTKPATARRGRYNGGLQRVHIQ